MPLVTLTFNLAQITRLLLQAKAAVNATTKLRSTALHLAVEHAHIKTVHLLLEHGAEAACFLPREQDGRTPLCLGRLTCLGEASQINSLLKQACIDKLHKHPDKLVPPAPGRTLLNAAKNDSPPLLVSIHAALLIQPIPSVPIAERV